LSSDSLVQGWENPPREARLRAYWWWLNGNATPEAITRDLEEMKAKGFGGALICDADGSSQDGNDRAPHGPTFFTPEWRELFKHTLREADRLGLEMSLNIQSGWNLGGPMVTPDDAAKKLTWSETRVTGPAKVEQALPVPPSRDGYYRDLFVVACRVKVDRTKKTRPIDNFEYKAMYKTLNFSAPDTTPLLQDSYAEPGEEHMRADAVVDLTPKLAPDGTLRWDAPEGEWEILRFGCTIGDHSRVSTSSEGWTGFALDVLDAGAFQRYWDAVVEPLIADAGPLAGKTLKYLHTDSWEVEAVNWTPTLRAAFQRLRGYDFLPWLPVLAGRIVNSRAESNRFLNDYRKTLGDLAIENHYRLFRDGARRHGMQIHPESGGPHASPVDAQRCLGYNDVPMSEFWAWSWRHRVGEENRFFVKQPASAAHTYGHTLVAAEGFTTIGPHWQETLWDNLKPSFDQAACEGLNLLVWHAFVCSPKEMGTPGQQYFAGTHLNPNVTWWNKSKPFFDYINRCQFLLQQGLFVADVCYYYGDHVPNFARLKSSDPARVLPGFDYDVLTEEALLTRLSVRDGRLTLPDGMSYRALALPSSRASLSLPLPVLEKIRQLVTDGATVIGPRPAGTGSLTGYPGCDADAERIALELWGEAPKLVTREDRKVGRGHVVQGMTAREVLIADGVSPDFLFLGGQADTALDYLHRRAGETEIYFVANRNKRPETVECVFRVTGKVAELWDPVTGQRRVAGEYYPEEKVTRVPLSFNPCGSVFVVFREPLTSPLGVRQSNFPAFEPLREISGPWTVSFDPKWGGPTEPVQFDALVSWTQRPEPGIRYYSGTATYRAAFDLKDEDTSRSLWLDLGNLHELAEVRLNDRPLGILWTPPFRVEISRATKPGANRLEVEVVNFWPNRIIGDASLPAEQRLTRTNIRKLTADTPLMESGLLGPVQLLWAKTVTTTATLESENPNVSMARKLMRKGAQFQDHFKRLQYAEEALRLDPDNVDALVWKGDAIRTINSSRYKEADACFEKALQLDPDNVEALIHVGFINIRRQKNKEAFDCFDRAARLDPTNISALSWKGNLYERLGQPEEALKCYNRVLEIAPDDWGVWISKGNLVWKRQDYEATIKCCDEALRLLQIEVDQDLENLKKSHGHRDSGPKEILGEPRAEALSLKARALEALQRFDEARACRKRAAELDGRVRHNK
jgi:tetratricopeptide (TPR) repeat protein